MRRHYDFSKSVKNPYARRMKQQITIRIDQEAVSYFKKMAAERGIPYQSLINLYLLDCVGAERKLELRWK
jgi:predicted DNA binding CopG/RHH family protein